MLARHLSADVQRAARAWAEEVDPCTRRGVQQGLPRGGLNPMLGPTLRVELKQSVGRISQNWTAGIPGKRGGVCESSTASQRKDRQ